jgi:hypothetical protein
VSERILQFSLPEVFCMYTPGPRWGDTTMCARVGAVLLWLNGHLGSYPTCLEVTIKSDL